MERAASQGAALLGGEDAPVFPDRVDHDTRVTRVTERPAWIAPAVVYGVVPRNFGPDGFRSVTARLDDLRDLGVAALWLAPITRTIPGGFGYEVTDYVRLRPEYGGAEDLRALVREAHARGIRVLMDVVPNHTSVAHPYFRDAEANGPASPYYDFYDRDAAGNPTHSFDWTHLPNLNYDNPAVRRWMTEAFAYWLREFDVDGFRVDAAWGVRQRRPDFWPGWAREMKRIKPDALLVAAASARDPSYVHNGFDAAYDWTDRLGEWAWGNAFAGGAPIGRAMRDALTDGGAGDDPDSLVFRFLNNNDTGPRFVTTHGVDCYRVALAMLLTLPGLPCLYTGDEVGAEFRPYDTTGPIDWSDRYGLRDHVKRLVALRRAQPSLHGSGWMPLAVEPAAPCFGYLRYAPGASPLLVLLNFSASGLSARTALPPGFDDLVRGGTLVDLLDGETLPVGQGTLAVPLPAWGARVLGAAGAIAAGGG